MREEKLQSQNPMEPIASESAYSQLLARVDSLLAEETLASIPGKQKQRAEPEPSVEEILAEVRQKQGRTQMRLEDENTAALPGEELGTADELLAQVRREKLLAYETHYQAGDCAAAASGEPSGKKAVRSAPQTQKPEPQSKWKSWLGEIAFYTVLIGVVLGVASLKGEINGKSPKSIAGFSAFTVLSSSMESVIPKGSLVITKRTDPKKLNIGDDITYFANQSTTITHRIIGIIESYEDTGQRAFEMKGVDNDLPDNLPVPAANVVGKVIFHSYAAGSAAGFISEHWVIILLLAFLLFGFVKALKGAFGKPKKAESKADDL